MVRRGFIEMHHDKLCNLGLGNFFPIGERAQEGQRDAQGVGDLWCDRSTRIPGQFVAVGYAEWSAAA